MSQVFTDFNSAQPFPDRPGFSARLNATQENVTGDNVYFTIPFNDILWEQGGMNFDDTTGIFTAPTTGHYLLVYTCDLRGLAAANTNGDFILFTSNAGYLPNRQNFGAIQPASGEYQSNGAFICDMEAADVANIQVRVSGGARVVDVFGQSGTTINTAFAGWFLG